MTLSPFPSSTPAEPRWSPRRSLAFVVASSAALWTVIIATLRTLF